MLNTVSNLISRFIMAWVRAVERSALAVLAGTILVTGILIFYTASNLTVSTDTGNMLSADLPFRKVYTDYKGSFPQFVNNLLVVVEADLPELAEDTAAKLARRMSEDEALFSYVFAPAAEPFFARNGLMFLETDELSEVIDRLAGVEPLLATLAADPSVRGLLDVLGLAIDDVIDGGQTPEGLTDALDRINAVVEARLAGEDAFLSWRDLLAGDNETLKENRYFIVAQPRLDFSSLQPARAALADIRAMAREIEASVEGDVSIRITGQAALSTEELSSVSKGASLAGIISLLLVATVLLVGLRSLRLVAAALLTLIVGLIFTASFATLAIGYLNMISVAFAVLFIGLGIDFGIHFCLRYREEVDRGQDNRAALDNTTSSAGIALAVCAPTTAVAFYAFIPTAYSGLGQLGLISGTGMFIALAVSLTVLPAMLALFPVKPALRSRGSASTRAASAWIRSHGKSISLSALALGAGSLFLVGAARFDFDPMKLRDPSTESVQTALDLFEQPDSSPYSLQVLANGIEDAAQLTARLKALDEVDQTVTLASLIPDDQGEKLDMIDEASLFLGPVFDVDTPMAKPDAAERRAALDQFETRLTALEEAGGGPELLASGGRLAGALRRFKQTHGDAEEAHGALEYGLFRFLAYQIDKLETMLEAEDISLDSLPGALTANYAGVDGRIRIEVFPARNVSDQDELKRFVRAVQTIAPEATGPTVQTVEGGDAVVGAMIEATKWAAILITLFLLLILRRVRDVLLVLVPLALAALFTVAATVVLEMPFNFANVIVLPLLIGLGVDGGIHLVMRAREKHDRDALLDTSTPRAVFLSALTTIGSFGSLAISSHRGTASMGELLMVAITITLLCMLVILPAMMAWLDPAESQS